MKKSIFSLLAVLISLLAFSISMPPDLSEGQKSELKTSPQDSSNEAFDKMMQVLMHQRCVNCHPAGDVPIKGEDSHVTRSLGISGGEKGHGLKSINCQTCHTDENNDFSGVPGAPHWALAPKSMAWEGKTRVEIATQMMDPKLNGGRSAKEIMEHLTEHELVLWAWDPGVDAEGTPRETPPVSKDEYIAAVKEWINKGAIIPNK
ncbi:MAG: hypothetical protein P1U56_09960 [Saprospiraceae bacterium]|nr:hypothetical protein [Saprospiraceae bacterium]